MSILIRLSKPLIFIVAIGLLACEASKNVASTPKMDEPLSSNNSLLWQISGNGLKAPSYLFGTMHIISNENYFFGENAKKKVKSAKNVVFEMDLSKVNIVETGLAAIIPGGKSIKDYLSEEDYNEVLIFMKDSMDINPAMFKSAYSKMKPIFLEQFLITKYLGNNPESYETNIGDMAKSQNKKIYGLETFEEQLSFLDKMPIEQQLENLVESIRNFADTRESFNKMIQKYLNQDIDGLGILINEEDTKEQFYQEELLNKRNTNWIPKLMKYFDVGSTFVAVGAGHLSGPNGVIELLRNKGYKVEPISMD